MHTSDQSAPWQLGNADRPRELGGTVKFGCLCPVASVFIGLTESRLSQTALYECPKCLAITKRSWSIGD